MGHWTLQRYFLLSNEAKKPSRLATNVNKHQEFTWKLGGYLIQFHFLNKLAVWEPGYNFREGSNSPLHGPDWTHFNEKMPVHWNWLIPHVLFPVRYVHLWGFPLRLLPEKRHSLCSYGIQRPMLGHHVGCHSTLQEDLWSPDGARWSSAPELHHDVPCTFPAHTDILETTCFPPTLLDMLFQ